MDDQQFLQAFEAAHLQPFQHRDHIRMAWLYLRREGWAGGYPRIQAGLKYFAGAQGAATMYHETITRFWSYLVHYAIQQTPELETFDDFAAAYPHLFDKISIEKHYSRETLFSPQARAMFVEPDVKALPKLTTS